MKPILFTFFMLFCLINSSAQNDSIVQNILGNNELKLNIFNIVTFKSLDASYEYILDSESSIGASVLINLRSKESHDDIYYREKFALTPYYRRYFSKSKYGYGFFVEAFAMYNVQGDYNSFFEEDNFSDETSKNAALGFAVGGKFLTRKGIVFDLFGGLGRNFITSNNDVAKSFVPRVGVALGYRF